ncbi:MAG: murein L,D-transpeptidase catalytic domain family protein [Aureispira sp.]
MFHQIALLFSAKTWFLISLIFLTSFSACAPNYRTEKITPPSPAVEQKIKDLYLDIALQKKVSYSLFRTAMVGFYNLPGLTKEAKLVLIDFSKPSTKKRLYVLDLQNKKLLFQSLVAHGRNSGKVTPTQFSNDHKSKQSSLGFYKTGETYQGKNGYSLRLDGLEQGINHHARQRSVVIHGADYASQAFIKKNGRLGRSWGCPALPFALNKDIIDAIKNKSAVFIYAPNKTYQRDSPYMVPQ